MKNSKNTFISVFTGILTIFLITGHMVSEAGEWRGATSLQVRYFLDDPATDNVNFIVQPIDQKNRYVSLALQPEYFHDWDDGYQSFTFVGFVRVDEYDDQRSHNDIREMIWMKAGDNWEFRAGIGKVFWGKTESRHLIDVVNQTDFVEEPGTDAKLGQPMLHYTYFSEDNGNFSFFLLPYFRERTFPSAQGRLGYPVVVDTSSVQYKSGDEERHVDAAIRWTNYVGEFDLGLSYFFGTSRDPIVDVTTTNVAVPGLGTVTAIDQVYPVYDLVHQVGFDGQWTHGSWIWKLEALASKRISDDAARDGELDTAVVFGYEYTFVGLFGSKYDLTIFNEWQFDERPQQLTYDNQAFIGGRFNFNDASSSEIRFGLSIDTNGDDFISNFEYHRRFSDFWKLKLRARFFDDMESTFDSQIQDIQISGPNQQLQGQFLEFSSDDDYVQVEIEHHF